jgi:diguanylate cyclase (GGDEF)-like protein
MKESITKIGKPALYVIAALIGMVSTLLGGVLSGVAAVVFVALVAYVTPVLIERSRKKPDIATTITREISQDRIDSLTGLANENGLMGWISENATRVSTDGKSIVILSTDLDGFDTLERTRGKQAADAVLIEVAKRVASCTGENGIAARTGNDEFAAIASVVPWQSREIAADQAGKLAELIQRPVELSSGVVWIGGFVGAAAGPPGEAMMVLAHAREALKQAKIMGRGHYKVYDPDHAE